jgi:TonB family protein
VRASVDVTVGQDGYVAKARIDESSGNAALDAALLSHIFQTWRFWPLAEGCEPDTEHFQVRFPESDCITRPILASHTPPAVAPQRQTRAVDLQIVVAPDGTPLSATVIASSGDAALDAAAVTHVKAVWRWEPIACKRVVSYLRGTALPVMDLVRVVFQAR